MFGPFSDSKLAMLSASRPGAAWLGRSVMRNQNAFDDPEFAMEVHRLLTQLQDIPKRSLDAQHPDHIRLRAERVRNGETLGRFADIANAASLTSDDAISQEAKEAAAALFDYVRDLLDLDEASFSEKIAYNKELESMLQELECLGTALLGISLGQADRRKLGAQNASAAHHWVFDSSTGKSGSE
jgi:hypothetical protein